MSRTRILYIEDEASLGTIVTDMLRAEGYEVFWEKEGSKVMPVFDAFSPDICVLDIMLPGIDGYTLCRTIREKSPGLPVIFLTAKTETRDLVLGFEAGGTDYIKKPFSIEELLARIENQLRLGNKSSIKESRELITFGKFQINVSSYELISEGSAVQLSNREMQVMKMLWHNRNGVTPRKDLLMTIWGDDSYFNSRNLDVYIRKLRGYFEDDSSVQIVTLKGNGYLFLTSE